MSENIPATNQAIYVFEKKLIQHCSAKNWTAVNVMIVRAALLSDIAKDLYQLDQFVFEQLFRA